MNERAGEMRRTCFVRCYIMGEMNDEFTSDCDFTYGEWQQIVLELLPEAAPNTVNSFIYAASRGFMDHHAIQRIVPGNWVDVTYQGIWTQEMSVSDSERI